MSKNTQVHWIMSLRPSETQSISLIVLMVFGAYVFAVRENTLPEGGLQSVEHTGWRVWGKEKNHTAFFRYKRNGLKLTLENRIFIPVSNALYRAVNTRPYFTE